MSTHTLEFLFSTINIILILNNKFNTICVFLSYSYIFIDVTVKDALLKVIFMVIMPNCYLALGLIVTVNKHLELGMKWVWFGLVWFIYSSSQPLM